MPAEFRSIFLSYIEYSIFTWSDNCSYGFYMIVRLLSYMLGKRFIRLIPVIQDYFNLFSWITKLKLVILIQLK